MLTLGTALLLNSHGTFCEVLDSEGSQKQLAFL